MNVLLVYAHPEPKSFNGAIKELTVTTLQKEGHQVMISDLYEMNFNPVAGPLDFHKLYHAEYFQLGKEQVHAARNNLFSQDIRIEQEKVTKAYLIIFQFPIWWAGPPTILKGWIDRVFSLGFAVKTGAYENGELNGKKALLSMTIGASEDAFGEGKIKGHLEQYLFNLQHETLYYSGMEALDPHIFWSPGSVDETARKKYLEDYRERLLQITEC